MPDSPLYSYLMNLGPVHLLPSNGLKLKSHLSKHLHRSSVLEQHTESLTADCDSWPVWGGRKRSISINYSWLLSIIDHTLLEGINKGKGKKGPLCSYTAWIHIWLLKPPQQTIKWSFLSTSGVALNWVNIWVAPPQQLWFGWILFADFYLRVASQQWYWYYII